MADNSIEEIIAERRLHLLNAPDQFVAIQIGRPKRRSDHDDYFCPVHVVGLDVIRYGGGVDALQALEEALRLLPVLLRRVLSQNPGLRWEDAELGDFGLRQVTSE